MDYQPKTYTIEQLQGLMADLILSQKETDQKFKESEKLLTEKFQETDRKLNSTGKMVHELEKSTKRLENLFITQWGKLMESLITPSCLDLFKERGLDIRQVFPNVEIRNEENEVIAEFDIILANGNDVVVVEVKTTMNTEYVNDFIEKLTTIKELMPQYKDKNIFGAVAGIKYDQGSARYAARQGLYVVVNSGKGLLKIANVKNFTPKAF